MGTQSHTQLTPPGAASATLSAVTKLPASDAVPVLPPIIEDLGRNVVSWPIVSNAVVQKPTPQTASRPRRHVLFVTADGDPGGGVTNVLQLCKALKREGGWRISLCSQTGSYAVQQARTLCDEVHEIDFFASRLDPRITWKLRSLTRKLAPDLIHSHGSRSALPASHVARSEAIPLINTVHGFHFYKKSMLPRLCAVQAERWIARGTHRTIFVCEDDRKIALREHIIDDVQKSVRIYHGIECRELPRRKPHAQPTVVLLARLVKQKHPGMLIEIADLLRDTGISFKFIGGGPLEPELRSEVARRKLDDIVSFSGKLDRETALQMATSADLAILPSLWEGFPIALLELLGMGIPVIAARVNGVPEVIVDGFNGFLVDAPDPHLYAERIRWLMLSSATRSSFNSNARASVAAHFSEARMAAEHLGMYRQIIATRRQSRALPLLNVGLHQL